jgi:L-fuconolactonase
MTDETSSRPVRVDAHHHFWPQPTRWLYPWMTDQQAALRRPFGPDDLRPLIQARQIDWTVLVQTRSSLDETRDFLAIADKSLL